MDPQFALSVHCEFAPAIAVALPQFKVQLTSVGDPEIPTPERTMPGMSAPLVMVDPTVSVETPLEVATDPLNCAPVRAAALKVSAC